MEGNQKLNVGEKEFNPLRLRAIPVRLRVTVFRFASLVRALRFFWEMTGYLEAT